MTDAIDASVPNREARLHLHWSVCRIGPGVAVRIRKVTCGK